MATKATVKIESPTFNQVITTPSVEVRGSWTGPPLTNPKVEVKLGGRSSGKFAPDASGRWSYTFTDVAEGGHEITAYLSADSKDPVDNGPVPIKVAAGRPRPNG